MTSSELQKSHENFFSFGNIMFVRWILQIVSPQQGNVIGELYRFEHSGHFIMSLTSSILKDISKTIIKKRIKV